MTSTTPAQDAEILRLHYAEHWPVGTIATQLELHPDLVRRVLGLGEAARAARAAADRRSVSRRSSTTRWRATPTPRDAALRHAPRARLPRLDPHAARVTSPTVRPRPRREPYLQTETLPGEQAQVDWAYVGKLAVPGGERALWLFVMVLGHSRAMWGEFVLDLSVHSLCRSLVRAAPAFGGVPRQWLFDNPKTVVLERRRRDPLPPGAKRERVV